VAGSHSQDPQIYILNRNGELVNQFHQDSVTTTSGFADMTWDGELLWGSGERDVFGINLEGELIRRFPGSANPNSNLTWDPDHEWLWMCGTTTNPTAMTREGQQMRSHNRKGLRIYGLAYWPDDPDGFNLYLGTQDPNLNTAVVYKMHPETGDTIRLAVLGDSLVALGANITSKIDPFSINYITIRNAPPVAGGDAIFVYQLSSNTSWMRITPQEGTLPAHERLDFTFKLFAQEFPRGNYQGQLIFSHNAQPVTPAIPVVMRVDVNSVGGDAPVEIPNQFELTGIHPNPFNAETTVEYALPIASRVNVAVYDLAGRSILLMTTDLMPAGRQSLSLDASAWPSGIYIARLEAGGAAHSIKLACLK
ncbi:MAG: T9SS type A sorting domain-containing protein, partial [Calditrichota bacterium]